MSITERMILKFKLRKWGFDKRSYLFRSSCQHLVLNLHEERKSLKVKLTNWIWEESLHQEKLNLYFHLFYVRINLTEKFRRIFVRISWLIQIFEHSNVTTNWQNICPDIQAASQEAEASARWKCTNAFHQNLSWPDL